MAFSSAKALRLPARKRLRPHSASRFNGLLIGQGVAPRPGPAGHHGGDRVSMAFSSAKALRLLGIFAKEIVWFLRDFVQTPQRDVQRNSVAKA